MRETLDVDVLIVGGGPAGMSAALRLAQLQKAVDEELVTHERTAGFDDRRIAFRAIFGSTG